MTLYTRCFDAHLDDLRAGGKGILDRSLLACLRDAIASGQRDVYVEARRAAGRQHSIDVIERDDRKWRMKHR